MARYKNGINGPVSGKIGNVIAASWRGIPYLRAVAEPSKKPASQSQQNRRRMFAVVMGWLLPILELINTGYQLIKVGKTPLNEAISYHIKEAVAGEAPDYHIDFKKAVFSRGELLISFIKALLSLADAILHIKWENAVQNIFSADTDQATFIIYNPAKEKFITFTDAVQRVEKEAILQLPANFSGDEVHAYMYYVNAAGKEVSTSLYLGKIEVG